MTPGEIRFHNRQTLAQLRATVWAMTPAHLRERDAEERQRVPLTHDHSRDEQYALILNGLARMLLGSPPLPPYRNFAHADMLTECAATAMHKVGGDLHARRDTPRLIDLVDVLVPLPVLRHLVQAIGQAASPTFPWSTPRGGLMEQDW